MGRPPHSAHVHLGRARHPCARLSRLRKPGPGGLEGRPEGTQCGHRLPSWPKSSGRSQARKPQRPRGGLPRAHPGPRVWGWRPPPWKGCGSGCSATQSESCPGSLGKLAGGRTGSERPSPMGRRSGPEPRALRLRPGSSPDLYTRWGQSSWPACRALGAGTPFPREPRESSLWLLGSRRGRRGRDPRGHRLGLAAAWCRVVVGG